MDSFVKPSSCFGGINCDIGYLGFYQDYFANAKQVYAIKGGPGTGKSHLMRRFAARAVELGERPLLIHCGSDAESLDGVYLPDRRIGILDGTSPHRFEPDLAGVDGELIDLGRFWDRARLLAQEEGIRRLAEEKKERYGTVYRLFGAMRRLRLEMRDRLERMLDHEKLDKAARRTVEALRGEGALCVRQKSAIGMGGEVTLPDEICVQIGVRDEYGLGGRYLEALRGWAERRGIACLISYHPIYHDELRCLSFPGSGIRYTAAPTPAVTRNVHMRRFRDHDAFLGARSEWRELARLCDGMEEQARGCFAEIRRAHFGLESIYTAAMDFSALDRFEERTVEAILAKENRPAAGCEAGMH